MRSWGLELEFGDVPKSLVLPKTIGKWEYHEIDIVNALPPYRGVSVDPLGVNPPVGGEINTVPTYGIDKQMNVVRDLFAFFETNNITPTSNCIQQTHVHVHDDKFNDLYYLKQLFFFIAANQHELIKVSDYSIDPRMTPFAIDVFKGYNSYTYYLDQVRSMLYAKTIDDFLTHARLDENDVGKRNFINFLPLKANPGTIEFRCFNCTVDLEEIEACMLFANDVLDLKLPVGHKTPKFIYDHELILGWEKTRKQRPDIRNKQWMKMNPI
jgi:hypothetical protein